MSYNFNNSSEGHITGLSLAWVNTEDITIGTGRCRDDTNTVDMVNGASITVQIDASAGVNALDGEHAEATSTWYHVYLISGPGQTTAGLLNDDGSPTMPSGYTHKRHIGWIYNASDDHILQFIQMGTSNLRRVYWNATSSLTRVLNNATNTGSYATVSVAIGVPPTAFEFTIRLTAQAGGDNATAFKSTDIINTSVWTRVRVNRSEYQMVTLPCPTNKEFQYESAHSSSECQAIIKGYSEVI